MAGTGIDPERNCPLGGSRSCTCADGAFGSSHCEILEGTYELVVSTAYVFEPDVWASPRRQTMVITRSGSTYHAETAATNPTRSARTTFDFTGGDGGARLSRGYVAVP